MSDQTIKEEVMIVKMGAANAAARLLGYGDLVDMAGDIFRFHTRSVDFDMAEYGIEGEEVTSAMMFFNTPQMAKEAQAIFAEMLKKFPPKGANEAAS